jgi:TolB-like protein/DNA-binding winged helix-turn-helix (wHTH) protein/Tfp pilus assembly protein PilF
MDKLVRVGKWTVEPHLCEISDGETVKRLEPKNMELLILLASANGELVTRQQIMDVVWKDRVVTEYALNNLISNLRKELNTKGEKEAYIATRPKLGYQLIAKVELITNDNEQTSQSISTNDADKKTIVNQATAFKGVRYHSNKVKGIVGAFLVILVLVLAWTFSSLIHTDNKTLSPSIVVLPFDVFDSDEEISYFADGLAEEIIHQLTVLPGFKVISRTSSFYFRNKDMPLTEIANRLDVEYVLEGSVRKDEDAMRVTLQLIEAASDTHIWSKVFTASRQNRFSIQFEISSEVAHSIDASFSTIPKEKRLYSPASSEAYLRVLKGRRLNQEGTADAYVKAVEEFRMATLLEPEYAEAYADLAMGYLLLVDSQKITLPEVDKQVTESLSRALELNPELANAHAVRAFYLQKNNKWPEAQESYQQALSIDENNYMALINYANLYRRSSQYEEAIKYYTRAKEIAPLSSSVYWGLSNSTTNLGRFDESLKQLERCVYLLTNNLSCHYEYAYLLRLTGQDEKANDVVEKIKGLANKLDFKYRSVLGFHNFWQQRFEVSNAMYEGLTEQFGINNNIVMSMPNVKFANGGIENWSQELEDIINTLGNKAYAGVHAGFAESAYLTGRCEAAIPSLEKIKKHRAVMMDNLLYFAHGTSYLNVLAYCYEITGDLEKQNEIITLAGDIFAGIPENEHYIGGFDFVRAQHAVLSNNFTLADTYLQRIEKNQWALRWRVEEDPILRQRESLGIESN